MRVKTMDTPSTSASFNTVFTSRKNLCLEEPLTMRPVDHCLIKWTINDFLKHSHFAEKSISSPPVQICSSDSWFIVVFPYFLFTRENNIQFCLLRDASRDKSTVEVTYRFGVKKSEVTWLQEKIKVSFPYNGSDLELYDIVEYFGSENALKENTLTILCEMYIIYSQDFNKLYTESMSGWAVDLLQLSSDLLSISEKVETADAKILFKSGEIPVHKTILAARSTVFAEMLLNNCSCINIPEDDICHIPNILIYIYSANFYPIAVNGIYIGFYESAKRYNIKGLIDILTPVEINVSSSVKEKSINFKWKMEKFSSFNIKYNECITSPPFHLDFKNEPVWHLDIYPEGSHRAPDSVGIFLRSKDMNKIFDIHMHISILDESGDEHCTKYTDKPLYPDFVYGFPQYISKRELHETEHLRGDKLIINCKIKTLYSIENYDKITSVLWPLCEGFACFEQLSADMENFLLFGEDFSDSILLVPDKAVFYVHKDILSARSPVFSNIMKNAKDNDYVVDITDVSPEVLEEIISFSYTGKMKAFKSLFSIELYKGAKIYMETLATRCSANLLYTVDEKSLCDVIIFAHKHEERLLFSRCLMYLKIICDKILKSKEWQNLKKIDENLACEILRWLEEPTDKTLPLTDLF